MPPDSEGASFGTAEEEGGGGGGDGDKGEGDDFWGVEEGDAIITVGGRVVVSDVASLLRGEGGSIILLFLLLVVVSLSRIGFFFVESSGHFFLFQLHSNGSR